MFNNPLELFSFPSVELITEYLAWDLNIKSNRCGIWKNIYLLFSEKLRISAVNVVYMQLTEVEDRVLSVVISTEPPLRQKAIKFYRSTSSSLMTLAEIVLETLV